jgi:alpha-tubulin suppressor-like RCC1 family protein
VVVVAGGESYAFGANKHGQLGTGTLKTVKGAVDDCWDTPQKCVAAGVTSVACGAETSCFLDASGGLLTCGLPQYGQLGHGTDHSYNKADGTVKIAYQPQPVPRLVSTFADAGLKVLRVACGHTHCVAVTTCGRVFTWGDGGYGRLGTKDQKEQWKPLEVTLPGGVGNRCPADCVVAAAAHCTFVSAAQHQLWYCGKSKTSGEAAMYFKPYMELSGWKVRSMSAGPATFAVAAETSVATWGAAIAGELALGGAKKTSAAPELVTALEGVTTHQVACGNGVTLFLVDAAADVSKMPVYTPPEDKGTGDKRKAGTSEPAGGAKKAR